LIQHDLFEYIKGVNNVELFKRKGNLVSLHPAQILVIGFGSLILLGTLLFMLPIATYEKGRGLSFIDA
jgi:trk system potassium uptake protein